MQDISYRKVERPRASVPVPRHAKPTSQEVPKVTAYVERLLKQVSEAGDWLVGSFDETGKLRIRRPARVKTSVLKQGHALVKQKVKTVTGKAGSVTRATVSKTVRSARTPLGKVTIIQSVAVLALFVYVAHGTFGNSKNIPLVQSASEVRAVGQTTTQTLHQFLPTAQDYVQPQPFQVANVQKTFTQPIYTWSTPWDLDTLSSNATAYAGFSAFWLTLNADGTTFQTKADWSQWQVFVATHRQPSQKLFLTVSGDPAAVLTGIIDPTNRQTQIDNLLQVMNQQGFDGIDIDYEGLGQTNRDLFTTFIGDLAQAVHKQNKLLAVTVEARISNQVPMDWQALGGVADQIRIMAYDYHASSTGEPGSIGPLGWVKEILDYASGLVDPSKIVVGLGNYGYDWQKPDSPDQSWQGTAVSFDQATALAKAHNAPIVRASGIDDRGYDIGSIPTFTYQDDKGKQHDVWFEDAASLQAKISLVNQYPKASIIMWSVGQGDSGLWQQQAN